MQEAINSLLGSNLQPDSGRSKGWPPVKAMLTIHLKPFPPTQAVLKRHLMVFMLGIDTFIGLMAIKVRAIVFIATEPTHA